MTIRASAYLHRIGLISVALLSVAVACHPLQPQNEVTRQGDDILASGAVPQVVDSVPGDVMLAGRDLRFTGAAGGDYLGAGGTQSIGGRVHGALRAAGGKIHLTATVDRNASIAGGEVAVDRGGVIGRNAYLAGGTVHIDGAVRGSLLASGGTVVLNGPVGGDVEVTASELFVGPRAAIAARLRYRVPNGKVHIDPFAHVTGTVTALPPQAGREAGAVFAVLWMLGFLVAGGAVVVLFPRLMADAAEFVGEVPGRLALIGLGWIVLVPIAIVLVACTVIGLPLALLIGILYGVLLYIGRVTLAIWLGKRVFGARVREGRSATLVNFVVGGMLLLLLRMIPIVGAIAMCVATVIGLGALILRVHRLRWTTAGTTFV